MTPIQIKRVKTLYSMMFGIPETRVDLDSWRVGGPAVSLLSAEDFVHKCKAPACLAGWACSFPPFMQQGLVASPETGEPMLANTERRHWFALDDFFGEEWLFNSATKRDFVQYATASEKKVALCRIRECLVRNDAITQQRSDELAALEVEAGIV